MLKITSKQGSEVSQIGQSIFQIQTPAPVLTRRVPEVVEKGTPAYVLVVRVPAGNLWVRVPASKNEGTQSRGAMGPS